MQLFRLDGKTALITGAGSGIGRATAQLFAAAGSTHLLLAGRRAEKLQESAGLITAEYETCRVTCIASDLATVSGRQHLVTEIKKSTATLDFLVNNAGIFEGAALAATTDALWERSFALNSTAPLVLVRDLADMLARSAAAAVVNISSTIAVKPIAQATAYNASKAALIQMTRSLALELGPKKIRINCILPAVVETAMYRDRFTDAKEFQAVITSMASQHPLGRVGTPADIAAAIVFLCSPAAAWVTGVALPIDGGMLCT